MKFLEVVEGQDLVMALGVAGSGKSTLMQSLVHGTDHVDVDKLKLEIKLEMARKSTKKMSIYQSSLKD